MLFARSNRKLKKKKKIKIIVFSSKMDDNKCRVLSKYPTFLIQSFFFVYV